MTRERALKITAWVAPPLAYLGGYAGGFLVGADPTDARIRLVLVSCTLVGLFAMAVLLGLAKDPA